MEPESSKKYKQYEQYEQYEQYIDSFFGNDFLKKYFHEKR